MQKNKLIYDTKFASDLIQWYNENKRDLPWRKTRDPYKIWLSEVILQQTRVNQGLPYYLRFIENFPTITDLAKAEEDKVLRTWQGLGYYSRAKNLHKCAKIISEENGGVFPKSSTELLKLPGIGPYTAAAIASFCFKETIAVVDGNVFRVLARYFGIDTNIASTQGAKEFKDLANAVISRSHPDSYNQAIMEFGATHCTPTNPSCDNCILAHSCYAYSNQAQKELPVKIKNTKVRDRYFYYIVYTSNGKLGMTLRKKKDIWQGLYDFHLLEKEHKLSVDEAMELVQKKLKGHETIDISKEYKHILSHQRIHATFITIDMANEYELGDSIQFYSKDEVEELPKPVLVSRYLNEYIF